MPRRGNREGSHSEEKPTKRRKYSRHVWRTLVTGHGRVTTTGHKGESKTAVRLRHETKVRDLEGVKRPSKGTLDEWAELWLRLYVKDKAPRTRDYYRDMLGHLLPHLGSAPVGGISSDELLLALEKIDRPATRRKAYEVLRIALNRAVKTGRVKANVCMTIDPPEYAAKVIAPPTDEQVAAILNVIRGQRDEALIVTALATGLRQGELVGLRWMDLEVNDARAPLDVNGNAGRAVPPVREVASAILHVRGQLDRNREYVGAKRGSERAVPLVPLAVATLEAHRQRVTLAQGRHPEPGDYIFTDAHGRPMTGFEAYRRWQVTLRDAGVPKRPMHASRHYFATVQSGEQRDVVSRLLGHKRSKVTEGYTHLSAADWERATERIDKALGG